MSLALVSVFLFFERLITYFGVFNGTNFAPASSILSLPLCMDRTLSLEPYFRVLYSTRSLLAGQPTSNSLRNIPYCRVTSFDSFRCESSLDLLLYIPGF